MALLTILQVFNNNVALVELAHHRQAVAKGSGIVFGKHKGDAIPAKKVDKLFILDTEVSKKNLYFLLKDIPIDVVTTTYEIIDVAEASDFETAEAKVNEAQKDINDVHNQQTKLLSEEAGGADMDVTFIMVHGQDTLMTTMLLIDETRYLIRMLKRIKVLENQQR